MSSDGRVFPTPLEKCSCNECGYGFLRTPLTADDLGDVYDDSYDLGLRAPESDRQRAAGYCDQISKFLAKHTSPMSDEISLIEFGCGTGSLLREISNRWPISHALGIEPAKKLVEVAQNQIPRMAKIEQGFVDRRTSFSQAYDVCISVNVIEHTQSPVDFLIACKTAAKQDGIILIICPDGDDAGSELLFRDHISSFSVLSLSHIASRAGLAVAHTAALEGAQQGFRIYLLRRAIDPTTPPATATSAQVTQLRNNYLSGWSEIQQRALAGLDTKPYGIFGIGEYADLLEAYCPDLATGATFFAIDNPKVDSHRGRPLISTEEFLSFRDDLAIAAVNPRSWSALQCNFGLQNNRILHPYQFTRLRTKLT